MGQLFALWPVSPHSSHIAVSVRGQSFRLWPFGSSVPLQSVHVVQDTRSSKRFCESCCRIRCIRFDCIRLLSVLMRRTCYTRGICTLLVSVYAQVLCIACSNWRTRCGRCGAIGNHNECRPCGKITAGIESESKSKFESNLQRQFLAAKLVQRQLEPEPLMLDFERTKSPR